MKKKLWKRSVGKREALEFETFEDNLWTRSVEKKPSRPSISGQFRIMFVDNFEDNFLKSFVDKISGKRSIQVLNASMDIL